MENITSKFVPLLFAGDYNVYSVARAFHKEYGIKITDYGKFYSGPYVIEIGRASCRERV